MALPTWTGRFEKLGNFESDSVDEQASMYLVLVIKITFANPKVSLLLLRFLFLRRSIRFFKLL